MTSENYVAFLARVHREDVEAGRPVMHKPGVCETCDVARKDADTDVQR